MSNPCNIIISKNDKDKTEKIVQCEKIMDGVVSEGMTVAYSRHFENMKYLESLYWAYTNSPAMDFVEPSLPMTYVDVTGKKQQDNLLNILNMPVIHEVNYFQQEYCQTSIVYLQNAFKISFKNFYSTNMTRRLALYIAFNFVLVCIYLFAW